MIQHITVSSTAEGRSEKIRLLIRGGEISLAGYERARIYGLLSCSSGRRMKAENRVFFKDEQEAIDNGYRPCGHCLPEKYKKWKAGEEFTGGL